MDLRETVRPHHTNRWSEVCRDSRVFSAQTCSAEGYTAHNPTPRADVTRVRTRQGDSPVPAVRSLRERPI